MSLRSSGLRELRGVVRLDRRTALAGLGATATLGLRGAHAEAPYPARPVRIIVPATPGGPYDLVPRFVADYLGKTHGWTIAVENRPGASGIVGIVAGKQAAPGGDQLGVTNSGTHGSEPAFNQHLPYDPYADLVPIVLLAQGGLVLLVGKSMHANSLADLLALIRARPGALKFSSAGYGTPHH